MSILRLTDVIDVELSGQVRDYFWRKTPSQTTTAGLWFDLSMSPGNPPPKYWFDAAPTVAKAVYQSTDGGFFHGANVSPSSKYLRTFTGLTATSTALPLTMWICDYLLYYPSIDDGNTDVQSMTNLITLPRYTDGKGVMMMAVTVAARTGGQQFVVNYTNSDGVAGRTSQIVTQNTATAIGTIVTSATATQDSGNPFIGLQSGDTGVRSVESITMLGADVGLFSLILVKPLMQLCIRGIDAPVEKDMLLTQEQLPQIYDDAYISAVCLPKGTLAATALIGSLKCIWG